MTSIARYRIIGCEEIPSSTENDIFYAAVPHYRVVKSGHATEYSFGPPKESLLSAEEVTERYYREFYFFQASLRVKFNDDMLPKSLSSLICNVIQSLIKLRDWEGLMDVLQSAHITNRLFPTSVFNSLIKCILVSDMDEKLSDAQVWRMCRILCKTIETGGADHFFYDLGSRHEGFSWPIQISQDSYNHQDFGMFWSMFQHLLRPTNSSSGASWVFLLSFVKKLFSMNILADLMEDSINNSRLPKRAVPCTISQMIMFSTVCGVLVLSCILEIVHLLTVSLMGTYPSTYEYLVNELYDVLVSDMGKYANSSASLSILEINDLHWNDEFLTVLFSIPDPLSVEIAILLLERRFRLADSRSQFLHRGRLFARLLRILGTLETTRICSPVGESTLDFSPAIFRLIRFIALRLQTLSINTGASSSQCDQIVTALRSLIQSATWPPPVHQHLTMTLNSFLIK